MKNRIRFISHRRKKVLLVDGTDCSAEQLIEFASLVPARVTANRGDRYCCWRILPAPLRPEERRAFQTCAGARPALSEAFRLGGNGTVCPKFFTST